MARGRRQTTETDPGRTVRVHAYVTEDEKRWIQAEAARRGMTVSDYMRELALGPSQPEAGARRES